MFWKSNTYQSGGQIETILQKENVCLQELMEEDELLQECKAQNKKVIEFLTKPEIIEELVKMIVSDPAQDQEMQVRFKNASLASELLTCDVALITDKLATSSYLLQHFYDFLHNEKPLNPLLASFVSRVLGMLVLRKSEQNWYAYQLNCFKVLDFLKSKGDFVSMTVHHIGTSAVLDLLSRLIYGVDDDEKALKKSIHEWLDDCQLVQRLVEKLSPEWDPSEHASVDQILCEIGHSRWGDGNPNNSENAQITKSILLNTLESEEVVSKMMDILLHEEKNTSSVSHVINVLITLIATKNTKPLNFQHLSSTVEFSENSVENSLVVTTILSRLSELQKIVVTPNKVGYLATAYGMEVERLGSTRLQVVNLISALVATSFEPVHSKLASLSTLQILIDMFYKFSLNNFLHTQVTQIIVSILKNPLRQMKGTSSDNPDCAAVDTSPYRIEAVQNIQREVFTLKELCQKNLYDSITDTEYVQVNNSCVSSFHHPLLEQLFTDCNIIPKLLESFSQDSELSDSKLHNTRGYMGHLREIANTIVSCCCDGRNDLHIIRLIEALPKDVQMEWEEFSLIGLAEINLINKILPLQDFRDGDMETVSDFRCSDGNIDENMSVFDRKMNLSEENPGLDEDDSDFTCDDNFEKNIAHFEKMCSDKSVDADDAWAFKEKEISFPDMDVVKTTEEGESHSSSEDEADDEFDTRRRTEEKMDVDDNGWSEVFDKRNSLHSPGAAFNPWQLASAEDTSDNSWANFEANAFEETKITSGRDSFFFSLVNQCNNVQINKQSIFTASQHNHEEVITKPVDTDFEEKMNAHPHIFEMKCSSEASLERQEIGVPFSPVSGAAVLNCDSDVSKDYILSQPEVVSAVSSKDVPQESKIVEIQSEANLVDHNMEDCEKADLKSTLLADPTPSNVQASQGTQIDLQST